MSKQALSRAEGMLSETSEAEQYQIVSALQLELDRSKTRLKKAQLEERARLAEKSAMGESNKNPHRWDNETTEALKHAVKEITAKTTIMMATEEYTIKALKDEEVQLQALSKENDGLRVQETALKSRTHEMNHQAEVHSIRTAPCNSQ